MSGHGKGLLRTKTARLTNERFRPVAWMLLAAAASAALNGMLAGFLLYPAAVKQDELELRKSEKAFALQTALQQKASERVDPGELAALLRRVPIRPDRERFILDLREIGRQSGVTLIRMTSGSAANSLGAEVPAIIDTLTGKSDARQEDDARPQGDGMHEEIRYELELKGTWRQVVDFVRRIGMLERLVTVPEWRITEEPPDATGGERLIRMTIVLMLYVGTGYEEKFPGVTDVGLQGGDDE